MIPLPRSPSVGPLSIAVINNLFGSASTMATRYRAFDVCLAVPTAFIAGLSFGVVLVGDTSTRQNVVLVSVSIALLAHASSTLRGLYRAQAV